MEKALSALNESGVLKDIIGITEIKTGASGSNVFALATNCGEYILKYSELKRLHNFAREHVVREYELFRAANIAGCSFVPEIIYQSADDEHRSGIWRRHSAKISEYCGCAVGKFV